jgi:hypothetical protein
MNLPRIISGQVKRITGANQELFDERHKVCAECPNLKSQVGYGEYCGLCGCQLEAKLRVKREICPIEKWLPVGNVNI